MKLKIITNKLILLLSASLFCISSMASEVTPITVKVALGQYVVDRYHEFLDMNQKQAIDLTHLSITDPHDEGPIRLVILEQALHKGGLAVNIDFIITRNTQRGAVMVQSGEALISFAGAKDSFHSSVLPSIQDSIRGIFGLESNHALMKVKTLEELKKFSAVAKSTR